jgi:hypothetical protein
LASLVYHQDFLDEVLHPKHCFRSSRLFTSGRLKILRPDVVFQFGNSSVSSSVRATGLPPHQLIVREFDFLVGQFQSVAANQDASEKKINERFHELSNDLTKLSQSIPTSVADILETRFAIDHQPLSHHAVEQMLTSFSDRLTHQLSQLTHSSASSTSSLPLPEVSRAEEEKAPDSQYQTWSWGGRFNLYLPSNYIFPRYVLVIFLGMFWLFS